MSAKQQHEQEAARRHEETRAAMDAALGVDEQGAEEALMELHSILLPDADKPSNAELVREARDTVYEANAYMAHAVNAKTLREMLSEALAMDLADPQDADQDGAIVEAVRAAVANTVNSGVPDHVLQLALDKMDHLAETVGAQEPYTLDTIMERVTELLDALNTARDGEAQYAADSVRWQEVQRDLGDLLGFDEGEATPGALLSEVKRLQVSLHEQTALSSMRGQNLTTDLLDRLEIDDEGLSRAGAIEAIKAHVASLIDTSRRGYELSEQRAGTIRDLETKVQRLEAEKRHTIAKHREALGKAEDERRDLYTTCERLLEAISEAHDRVQDLEVDGDSSPVQALIVVMSQVGMVREMLGRVLDEEVPLG